MVAVELIRWSIDPQLRNNDNTVLPTAQVLLPFTPASPSFHSSSLPANLTPMLTAFQRFTYQFFTEYLKTLKTHQMAAASPADVFKVRRPNNEL